MISLKDKIIVFLKENKLSIAASIIFFILYLLPVLHVNFFQNDDWYYSRQVENFLKGEFRLLADIGSTLYLQGFMGMVTSYFFGIKSLPYLTLLVSALDVFIFMLLLKINNVKPVLGILAFLVFISFPVFSYSIFGFMTENYILLYVLLSTLFFNLYINTSVNRYFYLSIIFLILSFFVKQNVLIIFLVYSFYLLVTKDFKKSIVSLGLFIFVALFYYTVFPRSTYMRGSKFNTGSFTITNIIFFIYVSLAYALVILIPLFSFFRLKTELFNRKNRLYTGVLLFLVFCCSYFLYNFYSTFKLFPYFGNTFSHLGYLYGSIDGAKPVAKYMASIFIFLTQMGPFIITFFVFFMYSEFKKIKSNKIALFYLLSALAFHFSSLIIVNYYDRYLLIPVVFFMLFIIEVVKNYNFSKVLGVILVPILLLNLYITYLFSWDFVLVNDFVYSKSRKLVNEEKVLPEEIYGNGAWIEEYHNKGINDSKYVFLYDKEMPTALRNFYKLEQVREIKELNPFFNKTVIYLFKQK